MDEASDVVFFNGPVQNGEFTFAGHPGKAVGIRIAAALNTISGTRPTSHLWNTVTLAGDLRYRTYAAGHLGPLSRPDFEHAAIAAKYPPGGHPAVVTDTADQVATLALEMIEARLAAGDLKIDALTVRVCARRSRLREPPERAEVVLADLRGRIRVGDTGWIMDKTALAVAMTTVDHSAAC